MNVLVISANSPFNSVGGIERYTKNFIEFCRKSSDENRFIFLFPRPDEKFDPKMVKDDNIYFSDSLSFKEIDKSLQTATNLFKEDLLSIIEHNKIDVICAENFHLAVPVSFSLQLNMIAGLNNIPLVLRLHSFATSEIQTEIINQLEWSKISCVSKSIAGDCFHKGADIKLLSTDYLGVNIEDFSPNKAAKNSLRDSLNLPKDSKVISLASRILLGRKSILGKKGIINTIKAVSKLSSLHPNLYFVVAVGRPPEYLSNEFNKALKKLQGYLLLHDIDERTRISVRSMDEMPELYQGSDLFVLPSENETFGQVFIEAMSCGTPVIGTKVGGIPEIIIDGYNGFLVHPKDATELAHKINKLVSDGKTRSKFVRNGKKTITDKFRAEAQFGAFTQLLESTLSD